MYYINACSTISHQPSFRNENWVEDLKKLPIESELISPNYKEYVNPASLRRMGKIIRMGLTCTKDCINQSGIDNLDAIIVGTGLGCLEDTEKFLNNILTIKGLIPPTSFIQSTHNTIAGQISLELGNHGYNMTHTQNNISFEHALIDSMLKLDEGDNNILVGAADEYIPLLKELANEFKLNEFKSFFASGSSFFILSKEKTNQTRAQVLDCQTIGLNRFPIEDIIERFLNRNNLALDQVDLILTNLFGVSNTEYFNDIPQQSIQKYSGYYFTSSSFGFHMACEALNNKKVNIEGKTPSPLNRILIFNNFLDSNIGLTLIESIET